MEYVVGWFHFGFGWGLTPIESIRMNLLADEASSTEKNALLESHKSNILFLFSLAGWKVM